MAIGPKLGEVLKRQGRSGKYLAGKLGKTPNTVSLWVTGKVNMKLEDIYAVCEVLNIEVSELLYSRKELKKLKSDKK